MRLYHVGDFTEGEIGINTAKKSSDALQQFMKKQEECLRKSGARIIIDGITPDGEPTCTVWEIVKDGTMVKTHFAIDEREYEVNPNGSLGKRVN